jgi:putative oxidoreductase
MAMFIGKYEKQIYALLRIVAGFLFLWHGSQKLFGVPPAGGEIPLHIVVIAGPIEFLGGILIAIGLWTRWVALIASGEMAYAYWSVHASGGLLPVVNHGELAVLYCFLFLFFSANGSGVLSVDHYLQRRRSG